MDLPDGPGGPGDEAGTLSHLRHGARAAGRHRGRRDEPRARGHDPAPPGRHHLDRSTPRRCHGRHGARARGSPAAVPGFPGLARACPGHPRRAVGWLAVLPEDVGQLADRPTQHVHPHRHRNRGGVAVQRGRGARAGPLPRVLPWSRRYRRSLLRVRCGHRGPRPLRPGPGAAGPASNERRHPGASRARPQDRQTPRRRRERGGRVPRARAAGGPSPRPAWRDGAGRRGRSRGSQRRRRVDGHRRAGAGGEGSRRPGDRRHPQRDGWLRDEGGAGGARHAPRPHRAARGRGSEEPGPDATPCRHRGRLVRPRSPGHRRTRLLRLECPRSRAPVRLCPRCSHIRSDHRVPMCPRPRHAHVHHGGRGARGERGGPDPRRRSPRNAGRRRHARARQDRHAHRRPATPRDCDRPGGRRGRRGARPGREPREGE